MGTPFIGQHDNQKMSMLIFLTWLNTMILLINTIFIWMF
jgi:hypothetical protein